MPSFAAALDLERYGTYASRGPCWPDAYGRTRPLPAPENRRDIERFTSRVQARLSPVVLYVVDGPLNGSNVASWLGTRPWDRPLWARSLILRPSSGAVAWQAGLRSLGTPNAACRGTGATLLASLRSAGDAGLSACGWIDWNVLPGGGAAYASLRRP